MGDREIKAMMAGLECSPPDNPVFAASKPLAEATVAIVTSASLRHPDQDDYAPHDVSFRLLDGTRDDLVLSHWSPGLDSVGFALDHNVVFPIDRLRELEAQGKIGLVSAVHMASAGNQPQLSGIVLDTGPAGAKVMQEAGVDVVLLTPV